MSDPTHRPPVSPRVAEEGQDEYPTYHDRPGDPPPPPPGRRRSSWMPIFVAVTLFAALLVAIVLWGSLKTADTAADAPSATEESAAGAADTTEPGLDRDVQIETSTGPGSVPSEPGAIDVPGGSLTQPDAGEAAPSGQ